jgi:hypothetical protein
LKPNLNLEFKTLWKINRKGIRKIREKEKGKAAQTSPVSPARPRARAAPPASGRSPLLRALSPSLAAQWRQPIDASFLHPLALSLSVSRAWSASRRVVAPHTPFILSLRRGPYLSVPPSPRSSWTGACALAHVAGFLDPQAQLPLLSLASAPRTPLTSFRAASPSLALCPRRQPPPETHARVPGHQARQRPLQASPSSAPR